MMLSNKVYDALKWICLVGIPATVTAYVGLAPVWGWPFADQISITANIVCTMIGALIGISTASYNKGK